jgi:hypothetical protein
MQYCMDHPEELSRLSKVKAQVSEVKGIMMENIDKVINLNSSYLITLLISRKEKFPGLMDNLSNNTLLSGY